MVEADTVDDTELGEVVLQTLKHSSSSSSSSTTILQTGCSAAGYRLKSIYFVRSIVAMPGNYIKRRVIL